MKKYSREHVDRDTLTKPRALKSWNTIPLYVPFVYLFLVVYGSLIPFDYRAVPFAEAWFRFLEMPCLEFGVASRLDWIVNILLYMPLGWLSVAWMESTLRSGRGKVLCVVATFLGCFLVTTTIEFLQIFFSSRAVSLSDIITNSMGAGGGIVLWYMVGSRFMRLWTAIMAGGRSAIDAALAVYAVLYVTACLFPFDFLLSFSELSWKLNTDNYDVFIAGAPRNDLILCCIKLIAEIIAAVPLGVLIGIRRGGTRSPIPSAAFLYGGAFGLSVELLQFFLASGMSQGVSVLTRILGVGIGLWLVPFVLVGSLSIYRPFLKIGVTVAAVPYFLLLIRLNGWFNQHWINIDAALLKLNKKMFIPFYYHHVVTETQAVSSLVFNTAAYLPIGFGYWAWHVSRRTSPASAVMAGIWAALVAAAVEIGKLFLAGKHPDFTNLLIAAVAAGSAYRISVWFFRISTSQLHPTGISAFEA